MAGIDKEMRAAEHARSSLALVGYGVACLLVAVTIQVSCSAVDFVELRGPSAMQSPPQLAQAIEDLRVTLPNADDEVASRIEAGRRFGHPDGSWAAMEMVDPRSAVLGFHDRSRFRESRQLRADEALWIVARPSGFWMSPYALVGSRVVSSPRLYPTSHEAVASKVAPALEVSELPRWSVFTREPGEFRSERVLEVGWGWPFVAAYSVVALSGPDAPGPMKQVLSPATSEEVRPPRAIRRESPDGVVHYFLLPHHVVGLGVLSNVVVWVLAILAVRQLIVWVRLVRGVCGGCGYVGVGSVDGRVCPECGRPRSRGLPWSNRINAGERAVEDT
jgi:hypothetical protein